MSTAISPEVACPKCGGRMWDQKAGKYPYKPGTPIFKCRDKDCSTAGGVIWEPKNGATKPVAPPPKSPPSFANRPEAEIPPLLRNQEAEDAAELAAKIAPDALASLQTNLAIYQSLTEWALRVIAPLYVKSDIGWSPEAATAAVATLYISAKK